MSTPTPEQALATCLQFLEMLKADLGPLLAEGVHTGLRKGTDAPDAPKLWQALADRDTTAWADACEFAADPFFSMWGGDEAIAQAKAALEAVQ